MNKGILRSISLVVRYDSYIISGLYQGESILLPLTLVHGTPCSHVPHGGYQYPPCIAALQGYLSFCKKAVEPDNPACAWCPLSVARDVLARMWVYNRINIFIYCLFFVFVCLVVGSRNPMRIPDKSTNKTQNE